MIQRCYLEITNVCNLDCLFCPKTDRAKRMLKREEFEHLTDKLQGKIRFLYFHLMGEPLLHPLLADFVERAKDKGFVPVITTNGTRLSQAEKLIEAKPYKLQISLHAHEGNLREKPLTQTPDTETGTGTETETGTAPSETLGLAEYMKQVACFAKAAAHAGIIIILRLWNQGGYDKENESVLQCLAQYFPHEKWTQRADGWKLCENIYLEYDKMFQWPDIEKNALPEKDFFCYALRNQIGVLVDGTVVPCCLDHNGDIVLGNLFEQDLDEILSSPRARAIYEGFSQHKATEALCQSCGYANFNKQYRKLS